MLNTMDIDHMGHDAGPRSMEREPKDWHSAWASPSSPFPCSSLSPFSLRTLSARSIS